MNSASLRLWLTEAFAELKQIPTRSLVIWGACLLGALILWVLAMVAKSSTVNALTSFSSRGVAVASTATEVDTPAEPTELVILDNPESSNNPIDDQALKRISETALSLHSRLQQGSSAAASYASKAGRVAGLAVAMRQDQLTNSDDSFWQPISEAIAELEQAVRNGEIQTGPAIGLITELRTRYAELHAQQGSSLRSANDAPQAMTQPSAQPAAIASANQVNVSSEARAATLPLSLRVLPSLMSLLPLGCLLFGLHALRRSMRNRHTQNPQAGYAQLASAGTAAQMTAAGADKNRHAAERKTQAAILQLLDEMEPLSEGDLTHEASVTEHLTGALADAFNHAVHELRRLVQQINHSSQQVRVAVAQSRERTRSMAQQGAVQAREVTRTHQRLDQMQLDVQSLSTSTQQVADYAQDVAQRTQHAATAVNRSGDALTVMRKQADLAERSMQRLVASTQGIESRLADIKTAASRTELLALNSTIHAASRGTVAENSGYEAIDNTGSAQNFAELATDVSSLATLLGDATRDIDQLSEVIRDGANDSLQAMQATINEVELNEKLSIDAQNHLGEIATAAEALGSAVLEIAHRTAEQAHGVSDVAETTRVINNITHDSATALVQAAEDLQRLENLSQSLEASVHGFRLPVESAS